MVALIALVVLVLGLLAYALASNPKVQEIGRLAFAIGLLVFLFHIQQLTTLLS